MIKNEKGVALGATMILMIAVGVGSFNPLNSSQEIKDIRSRGEAGKIFPMGGFLVRNNLTFFHNSLYQNLGGYGDFKGKLDKIVTTEFITKTVVNVVSPH